MSNYNCAIRTNYFKVKDDEEFEIFLGHIIGEELDIFDSEDENGNKLYALGCYGNIWGYREDLDDEDCECDYDQFIEGLQRHVSNDDAVIILEAGNERLRYVNGYVTVITSTGVKFEDITTIGINFAKELLGSSEYSTKVRY